MKSKGLDEKVWDRGASVGIVVYSKRNGKKLRRKMKKEVQENNEKGWAVVDKVSNTHNPVVDFCE